MPKILSFILVFFVYNSSLLAMDNKPYHHLSNGTFRNPEGSPERNVSFNWSFKVFNEEKRKLKIEIPEDHVVDKKEVLENLKKNKNNDYIAWIGVILGAAYMLWLYRRVIFGKLINNDLLKMLDLNKSEIFILSSLAIPTLFFGFYPEPLLNTIEVSINN